MPHPDRPGTGEYNTVQIEQKGPAQHMDEWRGGAAVVERTTAGDQKALQAVLGSSVRGAPRHVGGTDSPRRLQIGTVVGTRLELSEVGWN